MEATALMIRKARVDDGLALAQVMKRAYTPYLKQLDGIKLPPLEVDYTEEIKQYPVYQGKGIGYKLIGLAEQIAKEKGYGALELVTHVRLLDNIVYYSKLGYEEVERDENKVYFVKRIDNNSSK